MNVRVLKEIIGKDFNSNADVNYFFTTIRSFLERAKNNNYKVIKFYSDWMLHDKKENLKEMYKYFEELENLFNMGEIWDRRIVNKHIQKITSFIELREQLKELLRAINIDAQFLYEGDKWKNFSKFLRQLILCKPIFFKNLKLNSKYRKIEVFVVTESAPFMLNIKGALYWMVFINTSDFPYHGPIPESISLSY